MEEEGRGSAIAEYFQLYLFIFNIKRTNPKKECLGCFELAGWQGFCATAFFVLVLNFLLVPIGPSLFIVQSLSPGLGWCHLCSIRAWQNNGGKWEEVLAQTRVGMANWSHWGWVCSFWVQIWIFHHNPFVAVWNWERLSVLIPLVLSLCDGEDFPPSVWQCWLMCNNFSDHDVFGELGLSENWLKILVLHEFLRNCYHFRCDMSFILLSLFLHISPSFCHFKPLVCHLAGHDFTIMKVLIFLQ